MNHSSPHTAVRTALGRFWKQNRGTAAIEFALVMPVSILFFLGSITAFDAFKASRTMTHMGNTLVDLASRQQEVTNDFETALIASGVALAGDYYESMNIEVSFASVYRPLSDTDEDATAETQQIEVDWFMTRQLDGQAGTETVDALIDNTSIPLMTPGDSVVISQVIGTYDPVFDGQQIDDINMHRTVLRRPRFVQRLVTAEDYVAPEDDD